MTLEAVPPEPDTSGTPHDKIPRHKLQSGLVKFLRKTQRYSAYSIYAFAGLHLTSTVLLPAFSTSAAESAFMASRSVYQTQLGEILLVYGPIGAHVISGLALHTHRIYKQWKDYGRKTFGSPSRTAISGLVLTILASLHFIQTRWGPVKYLGDSSLISLDYISYLLQTHLGETSGLLTILSTVFAAHASFGTCQYFGLRVKNYLKNLAVLGFASLSLASLISLAKQPSVSGWMASQFALAHRGLGLIFRTI